MVVCEYQYNEKLNIIYEGKHTIFILTLFSRALSGFGILLSTALTACGIISTRFTYFGTKLGSRLLFLTLCMRLCSPALLVSSLLRSDLLSLKFVLIVLFHLEPYPRFMGESHIKMIRSLGCFHAYSAFSDGKSYIADSSLFE